MGSCGAAEGRTGRSNKCEQPYRGTVTRRQTEQDKPGFGLDEIIELSTDFLSDDGEDTIGQYKVIWSESGQTACDRYTAEEQSEFVFSQNQHQVCTPGLLRGQTQLKRHQVV